jgi:transcriptional regulator with XRE-family HTH domain
MKFGFILKELRQIKGVTQQLIADKLNIERSTYSKWETDKIILRVDQLKNIASIYGMDFEFMSRCIEAQKLVSKNDVERFIRMQEEKEKRTRTSPHKFISV